MKHLLTENIGLLCLMMLLTIVLIQLYKAYLHGKKTKKKTAYYESKSLGTTQKIRLLDLEKRLNDRLDKVEVDIAYIKNFTIKSEEEVVMTTRPMKIEAEEFKSPLLDLIKFNPRPLIPPRKKLFTAKEIDSEIRRKRGQILRSISTKEYKMEYDKAYKRLYYQKVTKKNKK